MDLGAAVRFSITLLCPLTWGWGWLEIVLKFPMIVESRIVEKELSEKAV